MFGPKNTTAFPRLTQRLLIGLLLLLVAARSDASVPSRILSLTPAGTEILFDLGLGDRVVGVTKYCTWPPEAKTRTDIGDMMTVNMETVLRFEPDLVLLSNMNEHLRAGIETFDLPVTVVHQDDFAQICRSMLAVGEACGVRQRAEARVEELQKIVADIAGSVQAPVRPRALVLVGRDLSDRSFKKVYAAGIRSFYNDLLVEAGAVNALAQDVQYAQISRENLLRLDPDIVLELVGEHGGGHTTTEKVRAQWAAFDQLPAAKKGNVSIVRGDFALRAGPRYPTILRAFIDAIHGGVREISE